MKAKLYRVEIGDSLTISHGWGGYLIWELYVPEIGIVVNDHGGCFKSDCRAKGDVIDVEIDDHYARILEARVTSNEIFGKANNEYFDMAKEKHKDITDKEVEEALKRNEEVCKSIKVSSTSNDPKIIDFKSLKKDVKK